MKRILTLSLLLAAVSAQAQQISEEQAAQTAREFFEARGYGGTEVRGYENTNSGNLAPSHPSTAAPSKLQLAYQQANAFYIYNKVSRAGEGSFVIVAADERATAPILGWSDRGTFDYDHAPCALKALLQGYAQATARLDSVGEQTAGSHQPRRVGTPGPATKGTPVVGPLLSAQWNQEGPYSNDCPEAWITGRSHCLTGCVATAVAQVMHYWQWPRQGNGKHTNTYKAENGTAQQVRDFSQSTYQWDQMVDNYQETSYTEPQAQAVARLMADVGCALNMGYSPYESGAYTDYIPGALVNYFGYSQDDIEVYGVGGDLDALDERLRQDLDKHWPVIADVGYETTGHAVVVDGYDDQGYFHLNYGWGGEANGYYLTRATYGDYSCAGHSVILGVHPSEYPRATVGDACYELRGDEASVVSLRDGSIIDGERTVTIPEKITAEGKTYTVTSIWRDAFNRELLHHLSVPGTVAGIPERAFAPLHQAPVPIRSVVLGDGVRHIGDHAFDTCLQLETLELGQSVETIGDYAFYQCWGLTELDLGKRLRSTGYYAFHSCKNLQGWLSFPATMESVGEFSFAACDINGVFFDGAGYTIGRNAFYHNRNLGSAWLEGAASIGSGAFSSCALKGEFTVSPTCQYEAGAVEGDFSLIILPKELRLFNPNWIYSTKAYRVEPGNPSYVAADGVLYDKGMTTLINSGRGRGRLTVTAGVKKLIAVDAVYVTLPASIETLDGAFSNNLREVTCLAATPPTVTDASTFPEQIHYYGHSVLRVPQGARAAYEQADAWKDFNTITDDGILTDGLYWYATADGRATIIAREDSPLFTGQADIPAETTLGGKKHQVAYIDNAFTGDLKLTGIRIASDIGLATGEFSGCANLREADFSGIATGSVLRNMGSTFLSGCTGLQTIRLSKAWEVIPEDAFADCTSLAEVIIDEGNTNYCSIDGLLYKRPSYYPEQRLQYCPPMQRTPSGISPRTTVTVADGTQTVACPMPATLRSATLPASVSSLEQSPFRQCEGLSVLTCMATTPPWASDYDFPIKANWLDSGDLTFVVDATLAVPPGTKAAYEEAQGWRTFLRVVERNDFTTGIGHQPQPALRQPANANDIYDLQGRRVEADAARRLPKGIYIVGGKKIIK